MCPPGPWPQSWPRAMASVSATFSRQRPGDAGGHLGHLEGVGEPGPLMVGGEDEDLGLARQAPEGGGVQDAVAVALEAGPPRVGLLGHRPPARRPAARVAPGARTTSSAVLAFVAPERAGPPPSVPRPAVESAWARAQAPRPRGPPWWRPSGGPARSVATGVWLHGP